MGAVYLAKGCSELTLGLGGLVPGRCVLCLRRWGLLFCSGSHLMEEDLSRLGQSLVLTEEEELGEVLPAGIWHSDPDSSGFHVVGQVLSHKPYRVEALKTVLQSSLNPAKGMDITFIENDRFLLKFVHSLDRDRVLASGPWAFEKNLIVLAKVSEEDDPVVVDLSWCEFFIRIHGLPLGKMTTKMARFIGGKIAPNYSGDIFSYERLPNFCYLYGRIGHISKWCESRFQSGFVDPGDNLPYGPWLRSASRTDSRTRFPCYGNAPLNAQTYRPRFNSRQDSLPSTFGEPKWGSAIFGDFPQPAAPPAVFPPSTDIPSYAQVNSALSPSFPLASPAFPQMSPVCNSLPYINLSVPPSLISIPVSIEPITPLPSSPHSEVTKTNPVHLSQSSPVPHPSVTNKPQTTQSQVPPLPKKCKYTKKTRPTTESNPIITPSLLSKRKLEDEDFQHASLPISKKRLGNPSTVKGLRDLLRDNNPLLVFLAETKCSPSQVENIKRKLNLFGCCVESKGRSGGLALLWHKSIEVQLQSFSSYHIDVSVQFCEMDDWWRFFGFYGEPDSSKRTDFWKLVRRLHSQSDRSWLCAGDFNEILGHSKKEGSPLRAEWQIRNFRECLTDCALHDLGYQGSIFTWCNNQQEPHTVRERLDRACANAAWSLAFLEACVRHLASPYSDHSPLLIELRSRVRWNLLGSRRRFRFEAAWLQESGCEELIASAWPSTGVSLREKVKAVEGKLSEETKARALSEKAELTKLILQEEVFWKQRSKVLWLKEGDRNTCFFHAKANQRHHTNAIRKLRKPDGSWTDSVEGVKQCILDYFQEVVTSSRPLSDDIQSGTEHLPTVVDPVMAEDLLRPYTDSEPQSLSQYRPISLCNVVYKIASKSITNRLKPWLDRIISPAQSAFVPGRLITDNVLLAFETNHFLNIHSKGRKHFMNLKLDISKAYDRVEWPFLQRVLGKLGFPSVFVDLIMLCVSSVSYSFLLSGRQFGSISPQRGLRQGDPLFPYLFLLCTESLSSLFWVAEELGTIPGVAVCRGAQGWHEKSLSQTGKVILIQAVVQAIPSYAMSCFRLPKTLLQEFQSLAANFFWHDGDRGRIHWLAWDRMCKSKLDGGLGFRNLEAFNLALLAKQL
ncbi:UNVERIFIED_CONTAM: LINE-1 retrotransposable element O protein [Sesamum latifolium]|uniref:LINE-1 retrotransposable element O protein n=1 Tax=Sesamum latifolium TaxID=2727402 RepID=A0AAW2Y8F8_9LAMI